jgi:predicted dehydrogenase
MMFSVAIIGCGRICPSHIDGFIKNADKMTLVAACDTDKPRAEAAIASYEAAVSRPGARAYDDYKQMLAETRPDIVTIATESGSHERIAVDCLESGSHVIVEKPMALSSDGAVAMSTAASRAGKKLGVCFQNRFNAPIRRLRKAVEGDRFGKILHGSIQVRWMRNNAYYAAEAGHPAWRGTWAEDGGTLMNQCIHGIDMLQWMLGGREQAAAVRVQAVTKRFLRPIEAEDFGAAIVEFANGAVGIIEGSACVYPQNLNETISLFGEKGSVVIGGIAMNKMETWRFADAGLRGDTEELVLADKEQDPPTVYGFGHAALFAEFIEALEQGREPLIPGLEGAKALNIILGIYKSQKTGLPVDLPLSFSTLDMI